MKTGLFKGLSIDVTVCTVLLVVFFMLTAGYSKAAEIHVGPGDSIQAAVDGAVSGDSIIVSPGNYLENIIINTGELTLRSESENPADTRVLTKDMASYVFHIKANGVTVRGFGISKAEELSSSISSDPLPDTVGEYPFSAGIYLEDVEFCTLENNEISNIGIGVYLWDAENNTVQYSTVKHSNRGVFLENSGHNRIENNLLFLNEGGINLGEYSWSNVISKNKLLDNSLNGIGLGSGSFGNLASLNNISGSVEGISLFDSSGNVLKENSVSNNTRGILLREISDFNEVADNRIESNTECGLYLENSGDNSISNNYFNNTENAKFEFMAESNIWNTTRTRDTSIVGGPFSGGNFWANPEGTGFSQKDTDSDRDGICDSPFNISGDEYDFLPLSNPLLGEEIKKEEINLLFPFFRISVIS